MPTPQDLQRLRALLIQLTAIGHAQRGQLIRAEDWNALVAAVTDVAQAVLGVDAAPTVPAHEHPDQVTSAWLAPALREVLERGPLSDPAAQQRLLDFEQRLRRLSDQLDESRGRVDEFRSRLTDVVTRDLEREAAVTTVRRAVENVVDPRPDLLNLRNTLASVQRDLGSVLQAAARLTVNGQVVDIGAVVTRVGQLEQFRERLRFANGELLDAAGVEHRLAEVENRVVTQAQLDDAIRNRPFQVPTEALAGIEDRLGSTLRGQVSQSLDAFGGQIRGEVDSRLNAVGDLVSSRLNDALPAVTQGITTSLNASIEVARRGAVDAALAGAAQALDARERAIRADLGGRIADVQAGLGTSVRAEVAAQLPPQLEGVRSDVTAVSRRLDAVAAQTSRHEDSLNQHTITLARLPQDQAAMKNDLRTSLLGEVDLRFAAANRAMDERFTAFDRAQTDRFTNLSVDTRRLATDTAQRIATDTATAQARDLRAQLLAEMRSVAREEVGVSVREQVNTAVAVAVKDQLSAGTSTRISPIVGRTPGAGGRSGPG